MRVQHLTTGRKLKETAGLFIGFLFFVVVIIINLLPFVDGKDDLMDFGSFYASGLKLSKGENPYNPNSEYIFDITFPKVGAGGKMMNLNPPISAMLFRALTKFDPHQSLIVWQILSAIIYTTSVFLLSRVYENNISPAKFIWAFMLAGFWHTLVLGQIYTILFLFASLGWILLQRKQFWLAGIAIGLLVAIKPNFLIWSLFLLVAGYTVTFLASIITGLAVSLIPVIFHGTRIYFQWFEASTFHPETLIMPGNNSIMGLITRFHNPSLGVVVSILVVVALLILSRLRSPKTMERTEYVSTLGILSSLLASPIAWTGYTILLVPIFFSIKKWTFLVVISAIILTIPFQIVLQLFQTSYTNFIIFGWLYGWAIVFLSGAVITNTMMTKSIQTN